MGRIREGCLLQGIHRSAGVTSLRVRGTRSSRRHITRVNVSCRREACGRKKNRNGDLVSVVTIAMRPSRNPPAAIRVEIENPCPTLLAWVTLRSSPETKREPSKSSAQDARLCVGASESRARVKALVTLRCCSNYSEGVGEEAVDDLSWCLCITDKTSEVACVDRQNYNDVDTAARDGIEIHSLCKIAQPITNTPS